MGTAIDDIVAAACLRLLPRCRCMCAACCRAGGSRRRSCITGRSGRWCLEPARRSTAAAPTTAAMTAARRPPSQPSCCPNRPEQASAGDRSHRRVDGATSRVRGRISMMRSQTSQKTPLATLTLVWGSVNVFGPDSLYQRAGFSVEALQRCIDASRTPRRHLNIFMGPSSCT